MTIGEIPYGCNSAKFVEVVREMREALVSALETIERQEVEIVALQRRVENIDRQSASDGSDTAVAKTYSGFCAAFFASNRRNATEQEIFDAGVRAGIARVSPAIDTAGAKPWIKHIDAEGNPYWLQHAPPAPSVADAAVASEKPTRKKLCTGSHIMCEGREYCLGYPSCSELAKESGND